jgi:FkbM family methyltransferase
MSYFYFNNNIDKTKVKTIFELGSRDLMDAKKLIKHYDNAMCYSFECNPDCLIECKKTKANFNEDENNRTILVENAVSIDNKKVLFRPFDLSIYDNMGASSMLEIDFSIRNINDPDYNRGKVQKEIEVNGLRIDTYMENNNIQNIDLLCIDLQGYELQAIKSLGEKIKTVKYIITECSIISSYKNGANFCELNDYLEKYGFKYNNSNRFGHKFPNLQIKGFSEFDTLFINNSAF